MNYSEYYLAHHGILKQKWGVRHGPPYPLSGGDYSPEKKKVNHYHKDKIENTINNKKHFDKIIRANKDTLSTLSYDKDRTKNVDMFYATYKTLDKHQYNALFNKPIPQYITDSKSNKIGTGQCLKYQINNNVKHDIKVASEDSASAIFRNLYSKDRDFYNFCTDESRMQSYFVKDKYIFKGYRDSRKVIQKLQNPNYKPTEKDINTMYRMFNYVIPYDGAGNNRKAHDVEVQRAKFFKACKDAGYGAVLDINDSIYGAFKATAPVIVFDMKQIVPKNVYQEKMSDKRVSEAVTVGRKLLGI